MRWLLGEYTSNKLTPWATYTKALVSSVLFQPLFMPKTFLIIVRFQNNFHHIPIMCFCTNMQEIHSILERLVFEVSAQRGMGPYLIYVAALS